MNLRCARVIRGGSALMFVILFSAQTDGLLSGESYKKITKNDYTRIDGIIKPV